MTTFATTAPATTARTDRDGRTAPRWAVVAAHLTALVTVPSGLWRLALAAGFSLGVLDDGEPFTVTGWGIAYVVGLSVVAEAVALLTIGLVRPWGERAPAWMPLIGGRRVPAYPVVAVAALGSLALTLIWGSVFFAFATEGLEGAFSSPGWEALMVASYAPLLLWGPLTAAVTYAYWRRRCRD